MARTLYADMGVIGFAEGDMDRLATHDEQVSAEFDRGREIARVAEVGTAP